MGYRSEVAITVYEPGLVKLTEVCKEHDFMPRVYKNGECYTFYWQEVKWYKGFYSEVDAVEAVLNELEKCYNESEDDAYSFTFLRVGEDTNDIEERYVGDYWLDCAYIIRRIEIEGDEIEEIEED